MKIVRLKLDHIKDDTAVFNTEDGKQIIMPLKYVPDGVKEDPVLYLRLQKNISENKKSQNDMAKAILEEILNGG